MKVKIVAMTKYNANIQWNHKNGITRLHNAREMRK